MPMDYYSIPAEDFHLYSKIEFRFVETHEDLCKAFAREVVDLIRSNLAQNQWTKIILPIGPYDFRWLAELCNHEKVSCESLVIFSMDQFCDANGKALPPEHPLNFKTFYLHDFVELLDHNKRIPPEQLILPDPDDLQLVQRKMAEYGPIDVTYGGSGIEGHYAFNLAPVSDVDLDTFINSTVHMQDISESIKIQYAMGGTGGNLEFIPPKGCSLGIKELLSAKRLHLPFLRSWHSGVLRRALFGPVTPRFPTSVVQLHPNVTVTITALAAALPMNSVLQSPPR